MRLLIVRSALAALLLSAAQGACAADTLGLRLSWQLSKFHKTYSLQQAQSLGAPNRVVPRESVGNVGEGLQARLPALSAQAARSAAPGFTVSNLGFHLKMDDATDVVLGGGVASIGSQSFQPRGLAFVRKLSANQSLYFGVDETGVEQTQHNTTARIGILFELQ
ncbi:MAG: hypothetical protein HC848_03075 [Limnobacter sp.]|nr:hypothetical protein [Limnobacter sp.]